MSKVPVPLPLTSQLDSVEFGMNTPVLPISELVPTRPSAMTTPAEIYDYDMASRQRILRKRQQIPSGHDPAGYVTKRIMARAEDGASAGWGLLLAVGAMLSWTAFAVLNAVWLKRHPQVNATEWANWLGIASGLSGLLLWWAAGSGVPALAAQPDLGLFALLCLAPVSVQPGWPPSCGTWPASA